MISMDKKYKTRDGKEVKIYSVEGNYKDRVHGAIMEDGKWLFARWTKDGGYSDDYVSELDLVEVKERKKFERWINVYVFGGVRAELGGLHDTKEDAEDARGDKKTFACVKVIIDCEEGEGL